MPITTKLMLNKKDLSNFSFSRIPSTLTELELDDPLIDDQDLLVLLKSLPTDSNINKFYILKHNLTNKSYETLLTFIKSHSNITSFYYAPIMPIGSFGSIYNAAMKTLIGEHKQLVNSKNNSQTPLQKPNDPDLPKKQIAESLSSVNSSHAGAAAKPKPSTH